MLCCITCKYIMSQICQYVLTTGPNISKYDSNKDEKFISSHTCPLPPTLRWVWPTPPCRCLSVCCTPAASGASPHVPRSERRSLLTVKRIVLIVTFKESIIYEKLQSAKGVMMILNDSYILQHLICSNNVVSVGLKICQCCRRARFYILQKEIGFEASKKKKKPHKSIVCSNLLKI